MNRIEICRLCLEERVAKKEQLMKEKEKVEIRFEKLSYEENMYYDLATSVPRFREAFVDRQDACADKADELEKIKKELDIDIKIVEEEIQYLEDVIEKSNVSLT